MTFDYKFSYYLNKKYAKILQVPFAYSSNGDGFYGSLNKSMYLEN